MYIYILHVCNNRWALILKEAESWRVFRKRYNFGRYIFIYTIHRGGVPLLGAKEKYIQQQKNTYNKLVHQKFGRNFFKVPIMVVMIW